MIEDGEDMMMCFSPDEGNKIVKSDKCGQSRFVTFTTDGTLKRGYRYNIDSDGFLEEIEDVNVENLFKKYTRSVVTTY